MSRSPVSIRSIGIGLVLASAVAILPVRSHAQTRDSVVLTLRSGTVVQIGRFRFRVLFGASHGQPAPRIEEGSTSRESQTSARGSSSGGSMSEGSVMTLVQHLAEMQNQFFEHSQLQMQLMTEMLAHLGRSQQVSVRQDLARIDEIGRELQDIKSQLASPPPRAEGNPRSRQCCIRAEAR